MAYRVFARRIYGCDRDLRDERDASVPFEASVEAGVEVDGTRAELAAGCSAESLSVTLSADSETGCGTCCCGGQTFARMRWSGALRLPAGVPRWRVRFVIDAARTFPRGPESPRGECVVELPPSLRPPIVIDAEHLERELILSPGEVPVTIDCDREPLSGRACFGVTPEVLASFLSERRLTASVRVRIDARPDSVR